MKLAQALLLRKQLEAKVKQLEPLKVNGDNGLFEVKTKRVSVTENLDELNLTIPKVEMSKITEEYDKHSTALRKLDAAIQETNWTVEISGFTEKDNTLD